MAGPLACRTFGTSAAPAQGAEHLKGRTIKVQRWVSYAMQESHHALGIPLYGRWADVHQLAEAAEADRWDFLGLIPEVLTSLLQQDQRRLWEETRCETQIHDHTTSLGRQHA